MDNTIWIYGLVVPLIVSFISFIVHAVRISREDNAPTYDNREYLELVKTMNDGLSFIQDTTDTLPRQRKEAVVYPTYLPPSGSSYEVSGAKYYIGKDGYPLDEIFPMTTAHKHTNMWECGYCGTNNTELSCTACGAPYGRRKK